MMRGLLISVLCMILFFTAACGTGGEGAVGSDGRSAAAESPAGDGQQTEGQIPEGQTSGSQETRDKTGEAANGTEAASEKTPGCWTEAEVLAIDDLPAPAETSKWDIGDYKKLRARLEEIPLDSCVEYFTGELTGFLADQENAALAKLELEPDTLSLVSGMNKKSPRNLIVYVELTADTANNVESIEWADELAGRTADFLNQYTYLRAKACELRIRVLDQNGGPVTELGSSSDSNETMFVEQPEKEYAAQTWAYGYSEKQPDLQLNKFGTLPETGELYVEYYVKDSYFDFSNYEKSVAGLEPIGEELGEYLLSGEEIREFMEAEDLETLTLSLYSGNLNDEYMTWELDV